MTPSHDERILRITEELAQLFNEQTQFFRKGVRETRTEEELLYYEESIERVRELFAELEQLRKAMG